MGLGSLLANAHPSELLTLIQLVKSDLQWAGPYGNLVPKNPHIGKLGDPASVSCHLCLTHMANLQDSLPSDWDSMK